MSNMNNFVKLIENDLQEEVHEERVNSTVSFEISIPLGNYEDKGPLAKDYASRDTIGPVDAARKKMLSASGFKNLPLNLNIKAFLKKQTKTDTFFDVHVSGGDEQFLMSIMDLM